MTGAQAPRSKLPFYYGYVVIAVAFVTLGIGVNSRTAFSLLYPAILDEFGWDRGATAGIFACGFLASVMVAPVVGVLFERLGPRVVIPLGAGLVATGLLLTTLATSLPGLYLSLGVFTVGGSVFLSYIGHSAFLPYWFVRRRGLMLGIAFSGVGVGGILIFPALQSYITSVGWREACVALALLILVVVVPLNAIAQRQRPEAIGLLPDGEQRLDDEAPAATEVVIDPSWAAKRWDYLSLMRDYRVWSLLIGYFASMFVTYAVQLHQTRFYIEVGFGAEHAAWALGLLVFTGIVGQVAIGSLSDRIGREWGWTIAMSGYGVCFAFLLLIPMFPSVWLMYAAAAAAGLLGGGLAPLFSAISLELFKGPGFGRAYGVLTIATALGAAAGVWITGLLYDVFGSYVPAFTMALVLCGVSALGIWVAAPGRVRPVAGRVAPVKIAQR